MKTRIVIKALLSVLVLCCTLSVQAAELVGARIWRAPDHTRLVLDLTAPVEHKMFSLENPSRLVFDLKSVQIKTGFDELALDNTPIRKIRSATRNGNSTRVVLDLMAKVKPRAFLLAKYGAKSDRLVIDLYDIKANEVVKPAVVETPTPVSRRDIIIAIDAGHGGEDPGAIGPRRLYEKNVVLAISRDLAKNINALPGFKAKLTRKGDYFLPLVKRRNLAREMRADLFVSVHADGFTDKRAHGASVFALSLKGATSETARLLAQRENEADLIGGVSDISLKGMDKTLKGVLYDLSMTATLGSSLDVGQNVLGHMGKMARLHKKRVEQANFAVLHSHDVPSILVETGFITNPTEAKRLKNRNYQRKMARSILRGIQEYFTSNPPAGTYLAWKKNGGGTVEYVISRGDTLSAIARRYNISVQQLVQLNNLRGSAIRVGQRLKIPTT